MELRLQSNFKTMSGHLLYHQYVPKERRREIKLLLLCALGFLDTEDIKEISSIANNSLDWKYLIETAYSHKLQYLLYRSLKKVCPESVPNEDLQKLELDYAANAKDSLLITAKLLSILRLLEKNDILALPFKGPVLAETVYGDYAARQFGDLDILIHRKNILKAINIFEDHGFKKEIDLNQEQIAAYSTKKNSIGLISSISGLAVDLHWEMSGSYSYYPFILNSMEPDLVHGTLLGKTVLLPSKEDLLTYLCLNGTKDCWEDLESLCSLGCLVQSTKELDWMKVKGLARKMRCERILSLSLFMIKDLFDIELSEDAKELLKKDASLPSLASTVYDNLFNKSAELSVFKEKPKFSMFHFKVRDRWSEKFRYGKQIILGPTVQEWVRIPVPAKLSFVYGILRPVRLFATFLTRRLRIEGLGD